MRAFVFIIVTLTAAAVFGQTGGTGALETFPFELPFGVLGANDGQDTLVRIVDASFEACVDHFQDAMLEGTELGDGWIIGGQGFDVAEQSWRFGLLRDGRTLYDLVVRRDADGCRVEITTDAMTTPGGRYRWSYPPLIRSDGTPIAVDPFVIAD